MVNHTVRTKLVKIGNSRGIRIPKLVTERLGLSDEIDMMILDDHLELRAAHKPREDWDKAFQEMALNGNDKMLDDVTPTKFDDEEWEW